VVVHDRDFTWRPRALAINMAPAMSKRRPRTERRERERDLRKQVREREKLAATAPGGAPDRPLVVTSASVIEGTARATPCVQCGGELIFGDHSAETRAGHPLRLVRLVCRLCHAPRTLWFRIESPLPS
jgi:hypothetical protein